MKDKKQTEKSICGIVESMVLIRVTSTIPFCNACLREQNQLCWEKTMKMELESASCFGIPWRIFFDLIAVIREFEGTS